MYAKEVIKLIWNNMLKIAGNKMKKYKLSLINKKKKKNSDQVLITIHVCLLRTSLSKYWFIFISSNIIHMKNKVIKGKKICFS
jgi:hypothetical protein